MLRSPALLRPKLWPVCVRRERAESQGVSSDHWVSGMVNRCYRDGPTETMQPWSYPTNMSSLRLSKAGFRTGVVHRSAVPRGAGLRAEAGRRRRALAGGWSFARRVAAPLHQRPLSHRSNADLHHAQATCAIAAAIADAVRRPIAASFCGHEYTLSAFA